MSSSTLSSCNSCALVLPDGATNVFTAVKADSKYDVTQKNPTSLGRSDTLVGRTPPKHDAPKENPKETHKEAPKAAPKVTPKEAPTHTPRPSPAESSCGYISTKYPQSPKLYTSLMKLVMKCLSVEAVADPSKPLFYGDATNGFCLSKVFNIPDLHARGAERKYAFLVVCDSESHLLASWHFVSTYISEMIAFLQAKVETVRDRAKQESVDNERYLRRSKNMPRSLVELAGDGDLFVRLHLCGIELLRDVL
ncbi:hypothetical protein JCM33374_g2423 [Metschnikowia sp. JCM 33374]|nr:hypothetical protein JCM33374_g2423 [Metschnikowia sp. JCM 33374]